MVLVYDLFEKTVGERNRDIKKIEIKTSFERGSEVDKIVVINYEKWKLLVF